MRRLVVALVLAVFVVTVAGCGGGKGGGGQAAEGGAAAPAGAEAAPPPAPGTAGAVAVDMSSEPASDTFELFPRRRGSTPPPVESRLKSGQPMLLFFFDSKQSDTDDQREQIEDVMDEYRGAIDLVSYDVSKALKKGAAENTATAEFSNLTGVLGVEYTPYLVAVDGQGYIVWRGRGMVDSKVIERAILIATD